MDRLFGFDIHLLQIPARSVGYGYTHLGEQEKLTEARQRAAHEAAQKICSDAEGFVADCVREQTGVEHLC